MRVVAYPADLYGCGWYRVLLVAKELQARGHDIVIVPPGPDSARYGVAGDMNDDDMVDAHVPAGTDLVVLQRVSMRRLAQAVPILRAKGVSVVIDVDDDLQHIHPKNPAFNYLHPKTGMVGAHPKFAWKYCFEACRDATMVTVSTPSLLARYAPHGRGRVLFNCVPSLFLEVQRRDSDKIGWGGSVGVHPDDLQTVGGAIRKLAADGHRFHVVGPKDGVPEALGLEQTDVLATGMVTIQMWPVYLAQVGIGVVPLSDTRFNTSKSWLKGLEQSALGVPWVASPRAEYVRLTKQHPGAGLLAATPTDWYRHLKALAGSASMRAEMSAAGREAAEAHTVEANAWRWAQAWEDAYNSDHAVRPKRTALGLPA